MQTKHIQLYAVALAVTTLTGCTGSPFSGSGVRYDFSHSADKGCTVAIHKSGDNQESDGGNVTIKSTGDTCTAKGGVSGYELSGKEKNEITDLVKSVIAKSLVK